ncbi:MAG: outer membrane protein transport protein [Pseudomonadales bacterium]|nr:outer membrane protein transport protein [Pseudomonadales bacterium]
MAQNTKHDNLVLRAGYEPRTSAIPDDRVDLFAPLSDAKLYTIGFGYQLDKDSRIDAAFGYLESSYTAKAGQSDNLNSTTPGHIVYNPYAFLDVSASVSAYMFTFSYEEKF